MIGKSEVFFTKIINRVDLVSTASQWDSLSISLLGSSDTNDSVSGKKLKGWWVNSLLVDNNEVLVGSIAQLSLEIDDLLDLIVGEGSLGSDELLSLLGVGPEETGMDLGLLVLEGDVKAKDVAVSHGGWEITVSTSVVENKSLNELRLSGHLVLHVHDLNHVQVDFLLLRLWVSLYSLNGINKDLAKWVSELWMNLGVQRGSGNIDEKLSSWLLLDLEFLEELKGLGLGDLHTFNKDSWMNSITDVSLGLSHDLSDEED